MVAPPTFRFSTPRRFLPVKVLALAASLALLTTACGFNDPESGGEAEGDRRFDIAVGIEPDTLDPAGTTTTTVANMLDYTVETLTRIDTEGKLQPGLAESWELAADGLALTFELRQGVTFHDGTPFNAEAVKFNLDRLLDPEVQVPLRGPYAAIDGVDVVDDDTVTVRLSRTSPALPDALSWTSSAMLSPGSIDQQGNSYETVVHPVGTGPYVFDGYREGDRITVTRYDGYYADQPYYETVVFRIVPEAASRESLLRAGQADLIILPPVADLEALQADPDTEVLLAPSDRTIFVAINTPGIDDPRVRQALNYAVNKQELIDNLLFGAAQQLDAPMSSALTGYCQTGSYDYDPQRAKDLLRQAGASDLTVQLGTPTGRYLQDKQVTDAVAGYLREVGVNAKLETMDWSSYVSTITAPLDKQKFDLHLLGWAPSFLDASQQMDQFESSQHPPDGLATSFYENPEVDKLIAEADKEVDPARREQLFCDAAKQVWEDAPWIFLWTQKFPIAYSADLTNVSSLPNEKFYAIYAQPK